LGAEARLAEPPRGHVFRCFGLPPSIADVTSAANYEMSLKHFGAMFALNEFAW
jgi:hypothetical protein